MDNDDFIATLKRYLLIMILRLFLLKRTDGDGRCFHMIDGDLSIEMYYITCLILET